ncbi:MAG: glycine cleavage T C-terminal barrel domain-containing protein [Pseudomonadota bacterium]
MTFRLSITPNIRKSPYFEATLAEGVRAFSVYNHMYIPGHYGDPEGEYRRLIEGVAQWDVAAQRQVELSGPDAGALAQYLTTRDLTRCAVGQGRYVALCDHDGTLINDPVLLKLAEARYWLSIADSDIALWAAAIARERGLDVRVFEPDVSPMAIQGPKALDLARDLFGAWVEDLKYFWFKETELEGIPLVLARSGWSKQGGFELYLQDGARGSELWQIVKNAGRAYDIGPGAPNDLERLESGLVSYGADGRAQSNPVDPFEIGLGHLVELESGQDFIGRDALVEIKRAGVRRRRVGLFIEGPPVTGNQHPLDILRGDEAVGTLSEMAYSHRLQRNIALGIVSNEVHDGADDLRVIVGTAPRALAITTLPFIAP